MIVLFTDFGSRGPYVSQMMAVLYRMAPGIPVVDLFSDVPPFDVKGASYLLAAYVEEFPPGTIFLGVVDPGVGGDRRAALVRVDDRWFVGPDNGLFNIPARRGTEVEWWDVTWRPDRLSSSFHGRDLFAPVAACIAVGEMPAAEPQPIDLRLQPEWPDELPRVVYVDHYGNLVTGVRASSVPSSAIITVRGHSLSHARTFCQVEKGEAFWYENANGLVEVAVNQGNASRELRIDVGDPINIIV
ncbi:MAG TPA: hypothetical protein ENK54_05830 [Thiotrichales bacterium]|nr:hypothetical protein [Thiotrichales bacterium]